MKPRHLIPALVLLVPGFEFASFHLLFVEWIYIHIVLVLAVIVTGIVTLLFRRSRRASFLFLSAGFVAALAGSGVYLLHPLFEPASRPDSGPIEGLGSALGDAFGPFIDATIAMMTGLYLGWLPAWIYLRSRKIIRPDAATVGS